MKVYFLSDIHLGARYITDRRAHEDRIVRLLEHIGKDAEQIYMLGDVLDYWFEYKTVVPRGYVRFFGALARLVDAGIKITWIVGNHDIWMFDYLRNEIGIEIIDGNLIRDIDNKLFYLAHGDDLGRHNNFGFRCIRSIFRNRVCQKAFAAIHPRWTVPFAHRWSSSSREKNSSYESEWRGEDLEPSFIFAKEYLRDINPDINFFILGHRHLLIDKMLSNTCRFIILGECYKQFVFGVWNGKILEIKQFES